LPSEISGIHKTLVLIFHRVLSWDFELILTFPICSKKWSGRQDINHYCSHCGCFIGRFVDISCMERCISRSARKQAAVDDMTLKTRPKDCAERAQKSREKVLGNREKKRAKKAAKELEKSQTQIAVHQ